MKEKIDNFNFKILFLLKGKKKKKFEKISYRLEKVFLSCIINIGLVFRIYDIYNLIRKKFKSRKMSKEVEK